MTSLYVNAPGILIDSARLPPELRSLAPFGTKWSFTSDTELSRELKRRSREEIEAFVLACERNQSSLEHFCFDTVHGEPVPDEAVLMQIIYRNFLEARSEMWLRQARK